MHFGDTWNHTAAPLTVRGLMLYMLARLAGNTRGYASWAVDQNRSRTQNYCRRLLIGFNLTSGSG
eukprot:1917466-Pleurochrysis_carterae.AAC.1